MGTALDESTVKNASSGLLLASLFGDHMVLQRGRAHRLWGWDRPGENVTLIVEGAPTPILERGAAGVDGSFAIACPELPAGGPYRWRIRGSSELLLEDVWVGEVWLASGQSNMEWKVLASRDAEREIASAAFPAIRMFNVAHTAAKEPQRRVDGEWSVCSPDSVADFSAVAYFFARELLRSLDVPVGIVNASWGGTPIEAWSRIEALQAVSGMDAELAAWASLEKDAPRLRAEQRERVLAWERDHLPADPGNGAEGAGWARPDFDDSAWPSMPLPGTWQARGLAHNGVVWFRRTIEIPAAWAGRDLTLSLGAIDDFDTSYFDGVEVGRHPKGTPGAFQIRRRYVIPGARVKSGRGVIAVRVFDHVGEGGLVGPPADLRVAPTEGGAAIRLAGPWRYRVEHAIPLVPMDVFRTYPPALVSEPKDEPSALFNGMIAPLIPFGLRGALWYQGENNVVRHAQYRTLQIALVRDWRARFGAGQFPFYWVQLASYADDGNPRDWPFLREAQTQALSEPHTGMAVTIDLGDAHDIHPRNKQDVGRRLAWIALARTYSVRGEEDSGPTLARVEMTDRAVRVHFRSARGLRTRSGEGAVKSFALAGEDGAYHPAEGRIDGETVVLRSALVPLPLTVRYAWDAFPEVNLENAAGLPAEPFRTDGQA